MRNSIKLLVLLVLAACNTTNENNGGGGEQPVDPQPPKETYSIVFNEDSAYQYVQDQVDFGPRVPGTMAHGECAIYLQNQLAKFCDTAFTQHGNIAGFRNLNIEIKNVIGVFNPEKSKRILLCAHWDTRPQADEDPDNPTEPADGANDGASGVGVLIEIARQLQAQRPDAGVDIVFFDAEDMGERQGRAETWCLGSQYWAKNPHQENYVARYGILLDMVGPKDAVFAVEGHSWQFAKPYVIDVWQKAASLGHGGTFVNYQGGSLVDDHYFINTIIGIPTLDIIHYNASDKTGFGDFWHTHKDNMESIDKKSLNAVGETLLKAVFDL